MAAARIITEDRQGIGKSMIEALANTDELFSRLRGNGYFDRSIPERHRLIFYLGHLEAFDWNLIPCRAFGIKPFHKEFDDLFAFGIDPVDEGLPDEPASFWPEKEKIDQYNRNVRKVMMECLGKAEFYGPNSGHSQFFNVAIEHRLMHAETLAYLFSHLPYESKEMPQDPPFPNAPVAKPKMVPIPAGKATLGMDTSEGIFGWDNEFGREVVEIPEFRISTHNVSNGQFLEFMQSGGYQEQSLWSAADWEWIAKSGVSHPAFWSKRPDGWYFRGMAGETKLPLDCPVYVSLAEASAYARWQGKTLPTESQFHRAAYGTPDGEERAYPWGNEPPQPHHGNFGFERWDPVPVGSYPAGDSAFEVADLVGNGWEWTRTVFGPLKGFERFPFYPGYSADFFDGKHYVMKGASPRTATCFLRRTFRNWFQAHYQYMYATFRLVDG